MPGDLDSTSNKNNNTYILDAESGAEMARLMKQDRLLTQGMHGVLAERDDVATMHDILDIACGPGGWALDVAFAHSQINVVGIDISSVMVEYARTQARTQGLDNANFWVMDILKPLTFPDNSFDFVNARFLVGLMPAAAWPKLLDECRRITRPGGIIRLTEFDEPGLTNSPAYEQWKAITFSATRKAGLTSAPDGRHFGITPVISHLLIDAGFEKLDRKAHVIDFSAWTEAHETMYQNCMVAFKLVQPFIAKMGIATQEELDEKYQQMLIEMMQKDFYGLWYYLTVWGQKPY
jgi:ubiquinone/menaquinone biosynthesis C-methylase UbiE